jgi:hypothetical protein
MNVDNEHALLYKFFSTLADLCGIKDKKGIVRLRVTCEDGCLPTIEIERIQVPIQMDGAAVKRFVETHSLLISDEKVGA